MKTLLNFAIAVASVATPLSAQAALLDARFSGTVDTQINTAFAIDAPVAGQFVYDTVSARFLSFVIGGNPVAPGAASSADFTPDRYTAIYKAQLSPVPGGGLNSTFTLALEGLAPWTFADAVALLAGLGQTASTLDTDLSSFSFYTASADGTGVRSLTAALGNISVTVVPEPGTLLLVLSGVALLGVRRARHGR